MIIFVLVQPRNIVVLSVLMMGPSASSTDRYFLKGAGISRLSALNCCMRSNARGARRTWTLTTEQLPPVGWPAAGLGWGWVRRLGQGGPISAPRWCHMHWVMPSGWISVNAFHVDDRCSSVVVWRRSVDVRLKGHIIWCWHGVKWDWMGLEIFKHRQNVFEPQVLDVATSLINCQTKMLR